MKDVPKALMDGQVRISAFVVLEKLVSCWMKFSNHLATVLLSSYHGANQVIKMFIITK